jgi:hypothetical protein
VVFFDDPQLTSMNEARKASNQDEIDMHFMRMDYKTKIAGKNDA